MPTMVILERDMLTMNETSSGSADYRGSLLYRSLRSGFPSRIAKSWPQRNDDNGGVEMHNSDESSI